MDINNVSPWFAKQFDVEQACARGELEATELLMFYGVPILLTTDGGSMTLTSQEQVLAVVQQQIAQLRADDYDHTEVLDFEVIPLNATSDLYRGAFARYRKDGTEIARLGATYLAADGPDGRRISALALHSPQ